MKVMALRHEAVLTNPGSYVASPCCAFDRDLPQVGGANGSVGDRDLVLTTCSVVANAQGISLGGLNRGRIRHAHNLRVVVMPE